MLGQVRLNRWNGAFFDAIEKRNTGAFIAQLEVFLVIIAALLVLVVAQTWLQERFKVRLRERLTHGLLDLWLKPNRAYQLSLVGEAGTQPDQRLQEDCRLFAELTTELGVGMLNAFLLLVSFIGVLWFLSSNVSFTLFGREMVIPGYMVWVAIAYAGLGSGLTLLVGRPLIGLNTERYAREAELRFALVRVNESAESVSLYNGEPDERRNLDQFVECGGQGDAPALRRPRPPDLDHLRIRLARHRRPDRRGRPGLSERRAVLRRHDDGGRSLQPGAGGAALLRRQLPEDRGLALRRLPRRNILPRDDRSRRRSSRRTGGSRSRRIRKGWLSFENLSIAMSDGSVIIEDATAEVTPGERVLIMGASGSGKSTLFRAIAGLWPWGSGTISIPDAGAHHVPAAAALPAARLPARRASPIPQRPGPSTDDKVRAALERCGLGDFADALDREDRWDKTLSLGQQQRVAFTRVLLHRPNGCSWTRRPRPSTRTVRPTCFRSSTRSCRAPRPFPLGTVRASKRSTPGRSTSARPTKARSSSAAPAAGPRRTGAGSRASSAGSAEPAHRPQSALPFDRRQADRERRPDAP